MGHGVIKLQTHPTTTYIVTFKLRNIKEKHVKIVY